MHPVAAELLTAASFFRYEHSQMYSAIFELAVQDKPAGVITVIEVLDRRGIAEDVGGLKWLRAMSWSVPSAARSFVAIVPESGNGKLGPLPSKPYVETLGRSCRGFVKALDAHNIFRLCRNGSLWLREEDIKVERRRGVYFLALGPRGDNVTREIAHDAGMICLLDLDGVADRCVLPNDEDDEGNPVIPSAVQLMYSDRISRLELLDLLGPLEFDVLFEQLTKTPEDSHPFSYPSS